MVDLSEKIKRISELSTRLSTQFNENRETVNTLNESSRTIKSLQFIVALPHKLRVYITYVEILLFQNLGSGR